MRYSWRRPNPFFLPALARPTPLFIYHAGPLPQAVPRAATPIPRRSTATVKAAEAARLGPLHFATTTCYQNDNPDLPTLQPWVCRHRPPSERFVFVRNPYFHRVDPHRPPASLYRPRSCIDVVDAKLIPVKTGAGETDLQARGLVFQNYTFLKQGEKRSGLIV